LKLLIFSIGFLLYYISNIFASYENYTECASNILFKHSGLLLSLLVCYFINYINVELGSGSDGRNKSQFKFETNEDQSFDYNRYSIGYSSSDAYTAPYNNRMSHALSKRKSSIKDKNESFFDIEMNNGILKKIRKIQSTFIEIVLFYSIITFCTITNAFFINNDKKRINIKQKDNVLQNLNNKWSYKCKLEKQDIILNSIEAIVLLLILIRGNRLLKYNNIFRCTKYITYASFVGIIIGPIINVTI